VRHDHARSDTTRAVMRTPTASRVRERTRQRGRRVDVEDHAADMWLIQKPWTS
jgi:hypothetical protein